MDNIYMTSNVTYVVYFARLNFYNYFQMINFEDCIINILMLNNT